mgnify:CR=1 FL=1
MGDRADLRLADAAGQHAHLAEHLSAAKARGLARDLLLDRVRLALALLEDLHEARAAGGLLDRAKYLELEAPTENVKPQTFADVDPELFDRVVNMCVEQGKICMAEMMALDAQGLDPQVAIQVQTHYVGCALVDAGCGDAIVDAITAQAMLRPGMHLRRLDPPLRVPISIMVRNQDPLSALHRDLIDRLKAGCAARLAALDDIA